MAPKLELGFDVKKIYDLTPVQRWLIALSILVVVAVLFTFLAFMPKSKEMTRLRAEINKLQADLGKQESMARNLEVYKREYERLNNELEEFLKKLPKASEVEKVLVDISNAGKEVNLDFKKFAPKDEAPNPKGLYATIPIDMEIEGGFHSVALFLDKVAKMERIVKPIDIAIKPQEKEGTFSLDVKLLMETYRYYESAPKEGQAKKGQVRGGQK